MTFVSFYFLAFVAVSVVIYYAIPLRFRWIVLLLSSCLFYIYYSFPAFTIGTVTTFVSYCFGLLLEKNKDWKKSRKRLLLFAALIIVLGVLIFVKVYNFLGWSFKSFIVPIGISYYTFSLVSYLVEIYWKKTEAERNFFKLLCFTLFFPKILEGPISRYPNIKDRLINGSIANYQRITFGIQLVIWGFFKKLVIAERAALYINNVFSDNGLETFCYSGVILLIGVILNVVQLYADFSGYMDIAEGISELYGIQLEANFRHPFLAETVSDFWRRWHITLSDWFKDYVYMPVVISPPVAKISTAIRKKYGRRAGKAIRNIIPLFIVWMLTGLWHGTGLNYLAWGLYWAVIMIIADVFGTDIQKLNTLFHINTSAVTWKIFRIIRTTAVFTLGKLISSQKSYSNLKKVVSGILEHFNIRLFFDGTIFEMIMSRADFFILIAGIVLLYYVGIKQEKYKIREAIASWNALPRWGFYAFSVTIVLLLGIYGVGYDTSSFAYMFF